MVLTDVKSSTLVQIGYAPGVRLLRVVYRDGSIYDHPDVSPEEHSAVMSADSKGRAMHVLAKAKPGIKLGASAERINLREPAVEVRRLESWAPDDCCATPLRRRIETDPGFASAEEWACPKCSAIWKAQLVGEVKHWEPVCDVVVF